MVRKNSPLVGSPDNSQTAVLFCAFVQGDPEGKGVVGDEIEVGVVSMCGNDRPDPDSFDHVGDILTNRL